MESVAGEKAEITDGKGKGGLGRPRRRKKQTDRLVTEAKKQKGIHVYHWWLVPNCLERNSFGNRTLGRIIQR